jgi:hypothetical protein
MNEFERFITELAKRKMWGGALRYSAYNYTHEDMLQCWNASRLHEVVEEKQQDRILEDLL